MHGQKRSLELTSLAFLVAAGGFSAVACEPKVRTLPESVSSSTSDAGSATVERTAQDPSNPAETGNDPPPTVGGVSPADSAGGQLGGSDSSNACGADTDTCVQSDAGGPPLCVPAGPRDCTSDLDNDCDGQPDNVIDDFCRCAPGSVEACDEHPGFDGLGLCTPCARTCIVTTDAGSGTSDWGACEGSVGPGVQDSCTVAGDDTDCDGAPNSGCACVDGETQACGSTTDTGPCQIGVSTCVNGAFGQCVGAVAPAARDTCAPGDDGNCNGIANEGCSCVDGETQACGSTTDTGPCQIGTRTCVNGVFGQCVGAVAPAARDACAPGDDANCNGIANEGCSCINGETQQCGSTNTGPCSFGTQTCMNGAFGTCQGAVNPAANDTCAVGDDANCNGIANEGCSCINGDVRSCGTTDVGACALGSQTCTNGAFGACQGL